MLFYHQCGYNLKLGIEKFCPRCGFNLQDVWADEKDYSIGGRVIKGEVYSTEISNNKGGVFGTGFRGNENIIGEGIAYTKEGNIIHININSPSSKEFQQILEKIIRQPTQLDTTSVFNKDDSTVNNIHSNKNTQADIVTKQQTNQILEEINKIEKKEGKEIQGIKVGDLQISKNELLLKEIILKGNEHYYKKEYNEAIEYYDKALKINPDYVDAWNNKAKAMRKLRK